jgi:hypothetical protein
MICKLKACLNDFKGLEDEEIPKQLDNYQIQLNEEKVY